MREQHGGMGVHMGLLLACRFLECSGILLNLVHDGRDGHNILTNACTITHTLKGVREASVVKQQLCKCCSQNLHATDKVAERRDHVLMHDFYRTLPSSCKILHQRFHFFNCYWLCIAWPCCCILSCHHQPCFPTTHSLSAKHSILLTQKCLLAKKNNSHTFSPFSPENRPGIGKRKRKQTDLHESSQIESSAWSVPEAPPPTPHAPYVTVLQLLQSYAACDPPTDSHIGTSLKTTQKSCGEVKEKQTKASLCEICLP